MGRQATVDLNADVGEGYPDDEALLASVTSANVCCGAHAGSWALSRDTLRRALARGVRVGAHPGYPDPARFGRATLAISQADLRESLRTQVGQLAEAAAALGTALAYVKPHGALYHDSLARPEVGALLLAVAEEFAGAILHAPAFARRYRATTELTLVREGFADRAYRADGGLVARGVEGAVLSEPADVRAQVAHLLDGTGPGGAVDSICVHGDSPAAAALAREARAEVLRAGRSVKAFA